MQPSRRLLTLSIALLAGLGGVPGAALARHGGGGDGEVRAAGTCGGRVHSELKVKARDGGLETEFELDHARPGSSWRVVVVQERRVVWRGSRRAGGSSGSFGVSRGLPDLAGADRISVRASGPDGVTCRASATLPGA
ncbi:MAG: hypothetical protein QOK49_2038 [Baekduia sp.]|nr:hypothetical protein [Baekduia sp.]